LETDVTAGTSEPSGTLAVALAHAQRLLGTSPGLALQQAEEILRVIPGQRDAILLMARAWEATGDTAAARETLAQLTAQRPGDSQAWRDFADLLHRSGDWAGADVAYLGLVQASINDPVLIGAALALREARLDVAETALRSRLKAHPTDIVAIRMLAEIAAQLGRFEDAANLLIRCLELCPGFHEARRNYAQVLQRQERPVEALAEADRLMTVGPNDPANLILRSSILVKLGDFDAGMAGYEAALDLQPRQPKIWMSYGHTLKTVGRRDEGVAAYRRALDQAPELGEVWWSLANLKTFQFQDADIEAMRQQLARSDLGDEDRLHLHFALAKALEDRTHYADAFAHYGLGNAIRHAQLSHQPDETADQVIRAKALYDPGFFASRKGWGCQARDPIFIVGLPRSGSTLVEQILSSHSQVEGTMELPDLASIARRLSGRKEGGDEGQYPEVIASLSASDLTALGEEYLTRTRVQRRTGRPLFIDKLPNNWMHVGLIQLILPNATIIDARRHPMGCCLSGYKQHFARGQRFTYDLADIGRYYRDYVSLMAHFDAVLPGRVHRVIYERMISDTEGEVRRLLEHCGLPFEDACLEFWRNDRAVRTASSEQVRQPIFADGVDHWRHFEPWLDPLKAALGPVLGAYPEAPTEG
jgi:tetratricopeptide (TPR) repeat protein